jgi:hypothetical protein
MIDESSTFSCSFPIVCNLLAIQGMLHVIIEGIYLYGGETVHLSTIIANNNFTTHLIIYIQIFSLAFHLHLPKCM